MALDPIQQLTEALILLREVTAPVLEATDGYRQACLDHGYSPTAAEQMAVDYHRQLVMTVMRAPT